MSWSCQAMSEGIREEADKRRKCCGNHQKCSEKKSTVIVTQRPRGRVVEERY